MSRRWSARAAALLVALTAAAGGLVAVASPARAASLGAITLSQTSGDVAQSPMFASGRTAAACPAGYGVNAQLRIGRPIGPFNNLSRSLSAGGYDTAPVDVVPDRSFTGALGAPPEDGEWWIVLQCFSLTQGQHPDSFVTPVFVTGSTWTAEAADPAEETVTTLAITPAGPVDPGTEVTLTADVEPDGAAGTVEFRRGALAIGTAPVTGADATATLATTSLPSGTHSITATFLPADPTAFRSSTSEPRSFTVTGELPGGTSQQEIVAEIAPGPFTLALASEAVQLAGGSVGGTATGSLPQADVTDLRGSGAGWTLTGQLEDFATDPVTASIPAAGLTWDPTARTTSGSGTVTEGQTADLGATRTLCSAAASSSSGEFACGAGLSLSIPATTPPGVYNATLTLTLA